MQALVGPVTKPTTISIAFKIINVHNLMTGATKLGPLFTQTLFVYDAYK